MGEKCMKLTLEDYEEFLANPNQTKLTKSVLNQIVRMHGFGKMHRSPKKEILDALNSIDLMSPLRSTLRENISSTAFLTSGEVNEDLAVLGWQECPVQSIETLKQPKDKSTTNEYLLLCADSASDLKTSPTNSKKPRSEKKRSGEKNGKKRRIHKETDTASAADLPTPSVPLNGL